MTMSSSTPFTSGGGGDAPIQLIHSNRGTNIYRHGNVGYKVLMCPEEDCQLPAAATAAAPVSEQQILKLVREQTISRYLPHGCNKRRVVDVKGFKGNPSLYFEWVEGDSLKHWMDERQLQEDVKGGGGTQAQDVMEQRLRVAMSITKTLDEFHYGGVACNFLSLDHIILQWTGNDIDGRYCSASLINLSRAVVFAELSEQDAKEAIRKDLNELGLILGALFSGESDVSSDVERRLSDDVLSDFDEANNDDECDHQPSKRGKQRTLGDGLPTYLSSMISAMVGDDTAEVSELYDNASDVLKDLQVAAKNAGLCLIPVPVLKERDRASLVMSNTFYGRRNEVALLTRSLQTVAVLGKPNVAVISGRGGAGKTALVNQIKKPLEDINGRFIQVKFDLNTQPDTVLFTALDSFIEEISDDEEGFELKQRIKKSLGSEISVVANSMPNIAKLIDKNSSRFAATAEVSTIHQHEQMKCALCKFIGSIATRKNPIVLFLDDLHWADKTSLDVIQRITVSPDISHCFFLSCYRDNDFALAKPVESMLDGIQSQDVPIIKVPLGRLEIDYTHEFISETLCLPPNLKSMKQLANAVHHKTGGLILYIKNFMYELCEEGLLCFNVSRRWQFDLDQIRQKDISDDVVEYLKHRMAKLAKSRYLLGLRVASCLGSSFSLNTFQRAVDMKGANLDDFVQFVEGNGFIQRVNQSTMHWAHDAVQQAAYKTISSSKVESLHLLIGGRLLVRTPKEDIDECVFDIVEQMNKGFNLIKTPEQKFDGAQLNLHAGQKAMSSLSFHSAAKYFICGIKILGDEFWGDNYDLTLSLHQKALEALFAIGDCESMDTIAANILAHATCFEDEVNAHLYQMRHLSSIGQSNEVIRKCKDLLRRLGEPLPTEICKNVIMEEFVATKAKLKAFTEEDLLTLPDMTDKNKLATMLFLSYTVNAAILCQPSLIPLLTFRGMNLTLDHGVSSLSASCIATYGCWLVNQQISDFQEGFRIGQVATKLMNRRGGENKPRVFSSVYGLINVWRQPFQACLDKLLEGYELGMRQGDIDNAFGSLAMYGHMTTCCGSPLQEIVENYRLYCKNAIMFKESVFAHSLVGHLQVALSLTGSSEDAYQTYFKVTKKDSEHICIQQSFESDREGYKNHFRLIPFRNKLVLFLMDGPDKEIKEWYELGEKLDRTSTQVLFPRRIFGFLIDGMIGLSFARKYTDEREMWEEVGNSMISKFQRWVESSEWNFANKLYLLLAERYFLQGDQENAFEHYDKAIKSACDHRFFHEEGLANVAAAKCCIYFGKTKEALEYYHKAKDCYTRWGATALVRIIDKNML